MQAGTIPSRRRGRDTVEQRRLLIAFLVSLVLIVAYQQLVLSRYRRPEPVTRSTVPTTTLLPSAAPVAPAPPGDLSAPIEDDVVTVETDVVRATLSSVGARLADLRLKAYRRKI